MKAARSAIRQIQLLATKDYRLHRRLETISSRRQGRESAHAEYFDRTASKWGPLLACLALIALVWTIDTLLLSQVSRFLATRSFVAEQLRGLATIVVPGILIGFEVILSCARARLARTAEETGDEQPFRERLALTLSIALGLIVPLGVFATFAKTVGFLDWLTFPLLLILLLISLVGHCLILWQSEHLFDAIEFLLVRFHHSFDGFLLMRSEHAHAKVIEGGAEARRALNDAKRDGQLEEPEWSRREREFLKEVAEREPSAYLALGKTESTDPETNPSQAASAVPEPQSGESAPCAGAESDSAHRVGFRRRDPAAAHVRRARPRPVPIRRRRGTAGPSAPHGDEGEGDAA